VAEARAVKVLKTNEVRADTTVIPANVAYQGRVPTFVAKNAIPIRGRRGDDLDPPTLHPFRRTSR